MATLPTPRPMLRSGVLLAIRGDIQPPSCEGGTTRPGSRAPKKSCSSSGANQQHLTVGQGFRFLVNIRCGDATLGRQRLSHSRENTWTRSLALAEKQKLLKTGSSLSPQIRWSGSFTAMFS